jgi:2'-5' RNA ligase
MSDEATTSGISLWLEPVGPSLARFQSLIRRLSRELGTPAFEPHLTLLGGLTQPESQVLRRTVALSERLAPVEVRLTRAGVGSQYFHFLFFEAAPTRGLLDAYAMACEALEVEQEDYAPHLSLAYAIPAERRPEELLKHLPGRPWGRFMAESLTVTRTEGAPTEWETLARLPLRG